MARIRTIKPGFFTSEDVADLSLRSRLTWIGLWTHCDDYGRAKDNARLIRAAVWPLDDVTLADVEADLAELAANGRIVRYEIDGRQYLAVTNWPAHQRISHPTASKIPPPPEPSGEIPESSGVAPEDPGTPPSGREGKGEGRGGDARGAEPPLRCPAHIHDPHPPPCRGCADARRSHEQWQRTEKARPTPTPRASPCPAHPGQPVGRCRDCESEAAPAPTDLRARVRRAS